MNNFSWDQMIELLYNSLFPALVSSICSFFLFQKTRDNELTKEKLTKFIFPAYKILENYFFEDCSKPEVQNALKEVLVLAQNQELLIGSSMMNRVYKAQAVFKLKTKETEIWFKKHRYTELLYGDEQKFFDDLCLSLNLNYKIMSEKLGIEYKFTSPYKAKKRFRLFIYIVWQILGYFLSFLLILVLSACFIYSLGFTP